MKKIGLIAAVVITSFLFGYELKALLQKEPANQPAQQTQKKRVTGIGGIFFKAKDPAKLRQWYQKHLGLKTNEYGAVFEWRQGADTLQKGFTQWSHFKETTTYFEPSPKEFMINYRVADLDGLMIDLKNEGVTILDSVVSVEYGKFVHILDPESNKLELWEPNDKVYEEMGQQIGAETTK